MLTKGLYTSLICVFMVGLNATDVVTKAIGLIGGFMVVLVQYSTIKKRFVDRDHNGSWTEYLKSLVKKRKINKKNGRKKIEN